MIMKKSILIMFILFALSATFCLNLPAQDKRLGRHTVSEWRAIIDSTWGPGLPTATKLEIFDFFWNLIDREYSGFPYLDVNWDSLKAIYRPQVEAGVSRGRFSAIMSKLSFSLQDMHAYIADGGVNGVDGARPSYAYGPPAPLFWPVVTGACGVFGAALTPLPDSSLLVYRAMKAHPLGLLPGDVVLGYDRMPWKKLYKEILAAEFPLGWALWGTTTRSITHFLLTSAGINWGLFDTIDVVKYGSGDTVHLRTAPLKGLPWQGLWANEQLAVPGVRIPDLSANEPLTWGVVEGTSIGYVYCPAWNQAQANPFRAALVDLLRVKKVTGLILDCRSLAGGDTEFSPDSGFDLLFSENPAGASRWRHAMRIPGKDHFAFTRSDPFDVSQVMQPDYYDRPIAVLTGPATGSMGDMHSFRLRFHPMIRFFGLPTNGAFCVPSKFYNNIFSGVPVWGSWFYQMPQGQMESLVNNEGLLMHKGFPVDEEVWLTQDGVARGEDDVVKRALEWITTLTHAHSIALDRYAGKPGADSVTVTAVLANPLSHQTRLTAIVRDGAVVHDSVLLYNDGLHGDGAAGDSLWGARLRAPAVEGTYSLDLQTDDRTEGTFRRLRNAAPLTTAGPLVVEGVGLEDRRTANFCLVQPYVRNSGSAAPFKGASVTLLCGDSCVRQITPPSVSFSDIAPGQVGTPIGVPWRFTISYDAAALHTTFHDTLHLVLGLGINGHQCWSEHYALFIPPTGVEEEKPLPTVFALEQNFPNPFNPKTVVSSQLPEVSDVRIVIYDVLGRKVKVLVNERRAAGSYDDSFDGSGLATGVYVCRMTAGSFSQSRKMILAK